VETFSVKNDREKERERERKEIELTYIASQNTYSEIIDNA
tara:strand:+ start:241 stop:360 length:120 start_codon:yes stop_codon:yes gene_type:complete